MKKVILMNSFILAVAIMGLSFSIKTTSRSALWIWKKSSATATTCPQQSGGLFRLTTTGGILYEFATYKTVNTPPATSECVLTFRITAEI